MPHIPLLDRLIGGDREPALPPIQSSSPVIDGIDQKALEHSLEAITGLVRRLPLHEPWTANDHARVGFAAAGTSE